MEVHIKLDLPENFTRSLGIDDDTIVESYIDSNSLHINIYAEDTESAIFPAAIANPAIWSLPSARLITESEVM